MTERHTRLRRAVATVLAGLVLAGAVAAPAEASREGRWMRACYYQGRFPGIRHLHFTAYVTASDVCPYHWGTIFVRTGSAWVRR